MLDLACGTVGPLSDKPGFDYMAVTYAGLTAAISETDRGPAQLPVAIADYATGVTAAMCVGFALLHRERTGEGRYIDCSLIDTYFNMHEVNVPKASLRGEQLSPRAWGRCIQTAIRPASSAAEAGSSSG